MATANREAEVIEVSAEEFQAWTENKVTRLVLDEVERYRDYLTKRLASGNTLAPDAEKSTERVVGEIAGLTQLYLFFSEANETGKVSDYDH